eukprot:4398619-Prymnesium_polylepis.1
MSIQDVSNNLIVGEREAVRSSRKNVRVHAMRGAWHVRVSPRCRHMEVRVTVSRDGPVAH